MCNRETVCEPRIIPCFVSGQFERAGISDIVERVARGERLGPEDADRLTDVPLPLLAKLVDLLRDHEPCTQPAVEPVVYLPLADWTEADGADAAVTRATATFHDAVAHLAELFEQDERVANFGDSVRTLRVVVDAIEPSVCERLKAAMEETSNEADISTCLQNRDGSQLAAPTDGDESHAADAMRAIAVARLASDHGEIRAPVAQLGIKAAHVALSFGASHLGQVAVDAETVAALHIPTLAEVADALRYDTPTAV
jgi:hypothetical protein